MDLKQQIIQAKSWEERYRLIIQAGRNLAPPEAAELTVMQPIVGCEAKVWFLAVQNDEKNDRTFSFRAYSEARIINGLLWLLLTEINGNTAEQLQSFSITDYFAKLGIAQRLSSTRLNGLKQIERLIQSLEG